MIRVCMVCKNVFGVKEPLEDLRETTGICEECWPEENKRLEEIIRRLPDPTNKSRTGS